MIIFIIWYNVNCSYVCQCNVFSPVSLLKCFLVSHPRLFRVTPFIKHITNYNILSTEQYGFRSGLRTDNAAYKLTTEILNAMNNKLLVGGIFCDLEKAFDCVNHDILLYQLKFYGISDKALQLYESYLGNRYCRTAIYNGN